MSNQNSQQKAEKNKFKAQTNLRTSCPRSVFIPTNTVMSDK